MNMLLGALLSFIIGTALKFLLMIVILVAVLTGAVMCNA